MMTVEDVSNKTQQQRAQLKLLSKNAKESSSAFALYADKEPEAAERQLRQITEVTGVTDERVLVTALNSTHKASSSGSGFDTAAAIEHILEGSASAINEKPHFLDIGASNSKRIVDNEFYLNKKGSDENADPNSSRLLDEDPLGSSSMVTKSKDRPAFDPPPNSPTSEGSSNTLGSSNRSKSSIESNNNIKNKALPIVDLTGGSSGNTDLDLEKAIKLSLEDVQKKSNSFGVAVSQEDQEISRALEASLLESQTCAKRKRGDHYTDPINPHDRERLGLWPVGMKNVGQTCWFSAVIQSLFHLPVFRNLVLNFNAPVALMENGNETRRIAGSGAVSSSSLLPQKISNDDTAFSRVTNKMEEDGKSNDLHSNECHQDSNRTRRIVEFMLELRKLFALMTASQRRYVDPSKALEILKGTIGSNSNTISSGGNGNNYFGDNQQDVSEFAFIVLEWIEEALKVSGTQVSQDSAVSSSIRMEAENQGQNEHQGGNEECVVANPLRELFYGHSLVEGLNNGEAFEKEETFGQYQLRVNGFKDIHESLENATAHEFFDSSNNNNNNSQNGASNRSGQEHWFTSLPPVLFFSLSRFHFNHERRLAEKIHNRLEFSQCLFMDRYLANNKGITRHKREQVRLLRDQRMRLQGKLDNLVFYGSDSSNFGVKSDNEATIDASNVTASNDATSSTLMDASNTSDPKEERTMALPQLFQCVINFASNIRSDQSAHDIRKTDVLSTTSSASSRDVRMSSPSERAQHSQCSSTLPMSSSQVMQVDNENEENVIGTTDVEMAPVADIIVTSDCRETPQDVETTDPDSDMGLKMDVLTSSYSVAEEEFHILKACLTRWQSQARSDMQTLQSSIKAIDVKMNEMYEDDCLKMIGYRLHAVMVHEGNVDSGHYWAYVYDPIRQLWLKFNDNTVSEASWEELQKESFGGHFNTSAYSLVYVQVGREKELWDEMQRDAPNTMEEESDSGLQSLLLSLPSDLAEFVRVDNESFLEECRLWDLAQEQQEKQNLPQQQEPSVNPKDVTAPEKEDVEVIEEKLRFVNTHSKLSAELVLRVLQQAEQRNERQQSPNISATTTNTNEVLNEVLQMCLDLFRNRYDKFDSQQDIEKLDYRLDSFVFYLMKNDVNLPLLQLAFCEHLSLSNLENRSVFVQAIHNDARRALNELRCNHRAETEELMEWHKTYHLHRLSAHYFVRGAKHFLEKRVEEALRLLTLCYVLVNKTRETMAQGKHKTLHEGVLLRILCSCLDQVNDACIRRFKMAEEMDTVLKCINDLILPTMYRLQSRGRKDQEEMKSYSNMSTGTPVVLETMERVGNNWCLLLGDKMPKESSDRIPDIVSAIVDPPMPAEDIDRLIGGTLGADLVDQDEDLRLASVYREIVDEIEQQGPNKESTVNV